MDANDSPVTWETSTRIRNTLLHNVIVFDELISLIVSSTIRDAVNSIPVLCHYPLPVSRDKNSSSTGERGFFR